VAPTDWRTKKSVISFLFHLFDAELYPADCLEGAFTSLNNNSNADVLWKISINEKLASLSKYLYLEIQ
jgi:hypothetical protein